METNTEVWRATRGGFPFSHAVEKKIAGSAVAAASADSVAEAQIAVAEAKVLWTEIAIASTNKLFELAGTRSTRAERNLDRHWRNARTLHDQVRWTHSIVGNALNGVPPPLHDSS